MNLPAPPNLRGCCSWLLFFTWIKAILCTATAIIVRPRLVSIGIAFLIGVTESVVDHPRDLLFVQFIDVYNDVALALSGLVGVAWWCIGRAIRTIAIYAYRARAEVGRD